MVELELLVKEIDIKSKPVLDRASYYKEAVNEIGSLFRGFFFNEKRTQKLSQPPKDNQIYFRFDSVETLMKNCLIDEKILEENAISRNMSMLAVFEENVAKSGLPISLEDDDFYNYSAEQPYTPNAQAFMKQFACALSICRLCLRISEKYRAIGYHPNIQAKEQLQDLAWGVNRLSEQYAAGTDLTHLFRQVKLHKKEIMSLLTAEKVRAGLNAFETDSENLTEQLSNLFDSGAKYLENCYKEFPNDAILSALHDRSWHANLKIISNRLYNNSWTYEYWDPKLIIKRTEFNGILTEEINQFVSMMKEKHPLLKIELLKLAAQLVTELELTLCAKLAEQGIEIVKAPKYGIFSGSASNIFQFGRQLTPLNGLPTVTTPTNENGFSF